MIGDIFIDYKSAEIREVKGLAKPNRNGLRVFCRQFPNVWTLQVRTHKPITEYGTGKARNMIAHVDITLEELKGIVARMEKDIKDANDRAGI